MAGMVLETGSAVPQVTATNQHGERVTVTFEEPTVLYFYPRDDTPGCTTEAEQFQAEFDTYREAGVAVYGVSTDDAQSHREFADKYDIEFDLLSDPDGKVADAFDVDVTDGTAQRTTFVCARRQVCGIYEGVRPDGHARHVLNDILELGLASLQR
jgi:peroxiredoxin Q/BCP